MPEFLLDGRGNSYTAGVTSDSRLMVDISGAIITIGSVSAHVDSIFIQSGNNWTGIGSVFNTNIITGSFVEKETSPIDSSKNNSAYEYTYTGGNITQVVQTIGASSYVQAWTWGGGSVLTKIGSWI